MASAPLLKLRWFARRSAVRCLCSVIASAIKPFVIGRKARLFANSRGGAQASAILYSMVETAKANGLMPVDYLMTLFEQLPLRGDDDDIDPLLPWNINAG